MLALSPTGRSVWVGSEGAWLFTSRMMKTRRKLVQASWSISHGDNNIASDVRTSCYVAELFSHRSQKPRPSDACCSFKESAITPPSLFNATQLCLSSLSHYFLWPYLYHHLHSLSLLLSLSVFFFSSAVHAFPEHLFPLALRQLNIVTGADSSAS